MDTKSLKKSVIDSYGLLAKTKSGSLLSSLFSCCKPTKHSEQIAKNIGYSQEILDQVPEDSNLGVGCGNPSALSKINSGETVVDLGSGAGFDAFIVSRLVGNKGTVIGVDLSKDMLNLARKNASKGDYGNVHFKEGDIEELPIEDQIANHVISNCVINLSQNKSKVFEEAYRVLKPGGSLSISDIVLEKELPDFVKNSLAGHIACVSGAEKLDAYIKYIEDAGFKDISIKSKSSFPLELMLTDPQIMKIAQQLNFNLDGDEAKNMASRVKSVSITAIK